MNELKFEDLQEVNGGGSRGKATCVAAGTVLVGNGLALPGALAAFGVANPIGVGVGLVAVGGYAIYRGVTHK